MRSFLNMTDQEIAILSLVIVGRTKLFVSFVLAKYKTPVAIGKVFMPTIYILYIVYPYKQLSVSNIYHQIHSLPSPGTVPLRDGMIIRVIKSSVCPCPDFLELDYHNTASVIILGKTERLVYNDDGHPV